MYTSLQIHRCFVKERINEERGASTSDHCSILAAFVNFNFFFLRSSFSFICILTLPNIFPSTDACTSDQQFINLLTRVSLKKLLYLV